MRRFLRRIRSEPGLTLIELLWTMPLTLLVFGGLVLVTVRASWWDSKLREQTAQQGEARAVVHDIVSELRGAYYGTGAPISQIGPNTISFYTPDRATPFHLRLVTYQVAGVSLRRRVQTSSRNFEQFTADGSWGSFSTGSWQQVANLLENVRANTPYDPADASAPPLFRAYSSAGAAICPDSAGATSGCATPANVQRVEVTLVMSTGGSQAHHSTYTDIALLRGTN
jgi:hypothetical protein